MPGLAKSAPSSAPAPAIQSNPIEKIPVGNSIIPTEVYDYFGITEESDRMNTKIKSRLNNILAYAYETKESADIGDLLQAIKKIELKLGQPHFAVSRFEQVHQYISIQRQINSLKKQQKAMFK